MNRLQATAAPAPSRPAARGLPAVVATWATGHIGNQPTWPLGLDISGARAWRASTSDTLLDIRLPHGDVAFHREVHAYRTAVCRLDPKRSPQLIAAEPRLRALIISQPRGRTFSDPAAPMCLLPRVHEDAGRLLRSLHEAADDVPGAAHLAIEHAGHVTRRARLLAARLHARVGAEIGPALVPLKAVLARAPHLPTGFCHGSFGPANWRWSPSKGLTITGFGRSQVLPVVFDFARPAVLWGQYPHLGEAFARGYGRPLTRDEHRVLRDVATLACVEDLHHALASREDSAISAAAAALRYVTYRWPAGSSSLAPSADQ